MPIRWRPVPVQASLHQELSWDGRGYRMNRLSHESHMVRDAVVVALRAADTSMTASDLVPFMPWHRRRDDTDCRQYPHATHFHHDRARMVEFDILPRLKAVDSRVPMSGCLGAHHSTAVSRGRLRLRRSTLSLAGAAGVCVSAASPITFPDAGRCPDLGISPGDSVVVTTVADHADTSLMRLPRPEGRGLRATFLPGQAAQVRRDHRDLNYTQAGAVLGISKDTFTGRIRRYWLAIGTLTAVRRGQIA
jgi:hypothetical protein